MMLLKCVRVIMGINLLLVILGCIGVGMATKTADDNGRQLPRRKVDITIEADRRQQFFDQLRKFADKNGFSILTDTMPSGDEDFLVSMTRADITISGTNPFAPEEYKLGFYDADRQNPAPESVFDDLVRDLEHLVAEIPGTTFSVVE